MSLPIPASARGAGFFELRGVVLGPAQTAVVKPRHTKTGGVP